MSVPTLKQTIAELSTVDMSEEEIRKEAMVERLKSIKRELEDLKAALDEVEKEVSGDVEV